VPHQVDAPTWCEVPSVDSQAMLSLLCGHPNPCHARGQTVLDPKLFDDLSRRLADNLPGGLHLLQDDLQRNLRGVLESTLGRLNLVTREEFEVQGALLERAQEKIAELEKRVATLEAAAASASTGDSD